MANYDKLINQYFVWFLSDLNPDSVSANTDFRELAAAYEVLIDPDSRRQYDVANKWSKSRKPDETFEERETGPSWTSWRPKKDNEGDKNCL